MNFVCFLLMSGKIWVKTGKCLLKPKTKSVKLNGLALCLTPQILMTNSSVHAKTMKFQEFGSE